MASSSSSHKRSFSEFARETLTVSNKLYDAFINHRGPDTKDTLAFALYESLEEMGFWTFLDVQELQPGDSIEPAIQNAISSSTVQIAIFSPGYAKSPWCLNELVDMLKTKTLFIPVFCDVRPCDLRYPDKGAYKDAFAEHEEKGRSSNETLNNWKTALHSSSLVSGYEFNTSNDIVEELCTKISLVVQQKVGKTFKGFPRYVEVEDAEASTSRSAQVKKSSLLTRDSRPVGIDSKVEDMVGLLEKPEVQAVAVVGMGGSGKTFLLQYVYRALRSRFDISIWLSISKSYSVKNLQKDIASHIVSKREDLEMKKKKETFEVKIASVSEERAAELINERLQGKRCLVVLDDLWTSSTEDNLVDQLGLQDCKVVVSTRNRMVAVHLSARTYQMKILSDEDSWKLFCVYAFRDCEGNKAPSHLEKVGHEIVEQCGNLPLAIKTTAASLASNTDLSKWKFKLRLLEEVLIPIGEHDYVMGILKLSYDSLPIHLKACFAYLSFFPEDAEIDCEYLVYLWIAEGFIPAGEEQWGMAWDCLDKIAQLCLIQVWEEEERPESIHYTRFTKFCNIHDLLHDLAIHISRENKCVFSLKEAYSHTTGASGWCRILLAKKGINENALSHSRPTYLRTLSLSENYNLESIPSNLFTSMRGLRVLDLSRTEITTLPESIGKMILLKVLNLRHTQINKVPECVRHLKSLLFLALSLGCKYLPMWISEIKCLQHLECEGVAHMPRGISNVVSLTTLRSAPLQLSREEDGIMRLEDLAKMTQLQEVRLRVKHEIELRRMEEGILARLMRIRYLKIYGWTGYGKKHLQLLKTMRAMEQLESLRLENFALPSWICQLANLRELSLSVDEFIECRELQKLPNLVRLELSECGTEIPGLPRRCRELPKAFGTSGGFPQLRIFKILFFSKLEEFPELEEGAMANLEVFQLAFCYNMKKVVGLEHLKRLKVFSYTPWSELEETLQKGREYWNKIKDQNPHVIITKGDIYKSRIY